MDDVSETKLVVADDDEAVALAGSRDENLRLIERSVGARIGARGNEIRVSGTREQVGRATELLGELMKLVRLGHPITAGEVEYAARLVGAGQAVASEAVFSDVVLVTDRGKPVKPHTQTQRDYVHAMARADLTFAIGPAGTGKTYLAMAMAVGALRESKVSRLILTRPALEAGERLGFLPGDIQAKVDPYLRPLFDALYDMMDLEKAQRLIEQGVIEVAPLAFMRGRTLNDSFIILDEAQNTTPEQMKMFLTRFGFGSKAVVTGDITQTDLPRGQVSGLNQVREVVPGIPGVALVYFSDQDVVRHELVQHIIQAYEQHEARNTGSGK
ncbi:MAG: PhoH family protein [Armatimonadota bacterium]|nr:PhoH family protein [Armatimonadota bacterium]